MPLEDVMTFPYDNGDYSRINQTVEPDIIRNDTSKVF